MLAYCLSILSINLYALLIAPPPPLSWKGSPSENPGVNPLRVEARVVFHLFSHLGVSLQIQSPVVTVKRCFQIHLGFSYYVSAMPQSLRSAYISTWSPRVLPLSLRRSSNLLFLASLTLCWRWPIKFTFFFHSLATAIALSALLLLSLSFSDVMPYLIINVYKSLCGHPDSFFSGISAAICCLKKNRH